MSDLSGTAVGATATRVGPRGAVVVGDYQGAPAAQAARAVRRAGLRPGLDREFGGAPETIGLVLAQEPHAGSEAQRGAMITLYVSAPAASVQPAEEPEENAPVRGDEPPAPSAVAAPVGPQRARRKRRARPRKARRPEQAPQAVGVQRPRGRSAPDPPDPAHWRSGESTASVETERDPAWDEVTLAFADVFKTEPPGKRHLRVYPRKPMSPRVRRLCAWLSGHRVIAAVGCMIFALAISGLARHPSAMRQRASELVAASRPHTAVKPANARVARRSRRAGRSRPDGRPAPHRTPPALAARRAASRSQRAAREKPPPGSAPNPAGAVAEGPAVAASTPAASQTQSGGGPFAP